MKAQFFGVAPLLQVYDLPSVPRAALMRAYCSRSSEKNVMP
jgi:hypothetical protein